MRASAVLVAIVSTGCFGDPPPTGGEATDDGGTATPTSGTASGSSDGSDSTPPGTSEDATSSSNASAEVTASGGVAECGNGLAEFDEPCDDGNDDDLDGCTQACLVGPIGLTIVDSRSPMPIGADDLIDHSDSCLNVGDTHALDTLTGWLGGVGDGDTWPTSLAGACRGLELVAQGGEIRIGTTDATSSLAEYGPTGGMEQWQLVCNEGSLPVGIRGRLYADATPYLRSIALECAEATVVLDDGPPRIELSMPVATGYTEDGESMCAPGEIAIGFQGHVDAMLPAIRELGPVCGRIELLFAG
jgi:cysteine-rich repeat protein